MDDIAKKKKETGVRYTISILIPACITYFIFGASIFENNQDLQRILLTLVNALPFGIDLVVKKGMHWYLICRRKKERSKYESNIKNILSDPELTSKEQKYYQNELSNSRRMSLETNKNALAILDNQIAELEK